MSDDELQHLKKLKQLEQLNIQRTEVTEAGRQSLREALPRCIIRWSQAECAPRAETAKPRNRDETPETHWSTRLLAEDERMKLHHLVELVIDRQNDTSDRWRAAQELGKIGHADAIGPLAEVIFDDDDSAEVRRASVTSVSNIADARSVEVLIDALTEEESNVWIPAYFHFRVLTRGDRPRLPEEWWNPKWTVEERREIQTQWREWWKENRDRTPLNHVMAYAH